LLSNPSIIQRIPTSSECLLFGRSSSKAFKKEERSRFFDRAAIARRSHERSRRASSICWVTEIPVLR
jgi:hypothetical protein